MTSPPRPLGPYRGPNISDYDQAPGIEDDPDFKAWSLPVPRTWFLVGQGFPEGTGGEDAPGEFSDNFARLLVDDASVVASSGRRMRYIRTQVESAFVDSSTTSPARSRGSVVSTLPMSLRGVSPFAQGNKAFSRVDTFALTEFGLMETPDPVRPDSGLMNDAGSAFSDDRVSSDSFWLSEDRMGGSLPVGPIMLVVDDAGELLVSGDGFLWETRNPPFVAIDAIFFDDMIVAISETTLAHSDDGGETWIDHPPPGIIEARVATPGGVNTRLVRLFESDGYVAVLGTSTVHVGAPLIRLEDWTGPNAETTVFFDGQSYTNSGKSILWSDTVADFNSSEALLPPAGSGIAYYDTPSSIVSDQGDDVADNGLGPTWRVIMAAVRKTSLPLVGNKVYDDVTAFGVTMHPAQFFSASPAPAPGPGSWSVSDLYLAGANNTPGAGVYGGHGYIFGGTAPDQSSACPSHFLGPIGEVSILT